jgi:F0F1-type ATP synthase membrane subunit b/b'
MEGWTDIMYKIFDAFSIFTVVYFIFLVFVGAFFLLNLTLAVIKAKFAEIDDDEVKIKNNLDQQEDNEEEIE